MCIISCPRHLDCWIKCKSGSGYANFQEAYGPCVTGCSDEDFAKKITDQFVAGYRTTLYYNRVARYSGRILNLSARALTELGESLLREAPGLVDEEAEILARRARDSEDQSITTDWKNMRVTEVLVVLEASFDAPSPSLEF